MTVTQVDQILDRDDSPPLLSGWSEKPRPDRVNNITHKPFPQQMTNTLFVVTIEMLCNENKTRKLFM